MKETLGRMSGPQDGRGRVERAGSPLSPSKFSHAPNDEVITLDYTQRIWNWQWRNHGFIQ
jgi:hypothetical protein